MSKSTARSSSPLPWILIASAAAIALGVLLWLRAGEPEGETAGSDPNAETRDPKQRGSGSAVSPSGSIRSTAPALGRASGTVQARGGEALAHAMVTLAPHDSERGETETTEPMVTHTDARGQWSLEAISPGRYTLSATALGYLPGRVPNLRFAAQAERSGLALTLDPGGNLLSGTIRDATGGVIEAGLVRLSPVMGLAGIRDSFFASSDEQGRYAVQVPDGRFRVTASHPDYSSARAVLDLSGGARERDFELVPMGVITGVVRRESDESRVPGASVTWSRQRMFEVPHGGRVTINERGGSVRTDDQGKFVIRGLPPGTVSLAARAPGLATAAPTQVPVAMAEHIEGIEVWTVEAADIRGRVVARSPEDPDAPGLGGALVKATARYGPDVSTTTDEHGNFTIEGLLPGSYSLLAEAEGFSADGEPTQIEIDGPDPDATPILLELIHARGIRGRIEPPTRAEVAIQLRPGDLAWGSGGSEGLLMLSAGADGASTNPDTGSFELSPIPPGTYTLEARAADGRGGTVEVVVGPEGADGVVITLEQRATLAGTVRDGAGNPVGDVSVSVRQPAGPSAGLSVIVNGRELTAISSPSDAEGRYEIPGLSAGRWELGVVDDSGAALAWADGGRGPLSLTLADGERREPLDLRVETRDGEIRGVVTDAEGAPVADAWVHAVSLPAADPSEAEPARSQTDGEDDDDDDDDGEPRSMTQMIVASSDSGGPSKPPVLTDADGRFTIAGLRHSEYRLHAEAEGGSNTATAVATPDADIHLRLTPLGAIEGEVSSSDGQPARCVVQIDGPSGVRVARVRDGRFSFERLEPGPYTVEASTQDGATSSSLTVEAGVTADLELSLERFATLTGTIVDAQGAPLADAKITIATGEDGRIELTNDGREPPNKTDAEGKFEIEAAAGDRLLVVQGSDSPIPLAVQPVVVVAGEDRDLGEIRERDLGATIETEDDGPTHK